MRTGAGRDSIFIATALRIKWPHPCFIDKTPVAGVKEVEKSIPTVFILKFSYCRIFCVEFNLEPVLFVNLLFFM